MLLRTLARSVTAVSVDEVVALIVQMNPLPDSMADITRKVAENRWRKQVQAIAAPIVASYGDGPATIKS